ncbi:MAG: tetratricopeptide repeat protein [Desulfobacterales bacterium]|nr:tetratricopeptide repeat protein [Desulfobacterales bacterium]
MAESKRTNFFYIICFFSFICLFVLYCPLNYTKISLVYAGYFEKDSFKQYVRKGQKAFKNKEFDEALSLFEHAIHIAQDNKYFRHHLPALYKYSRESAYMVQNLKKALHHANTLADYMAKYKPDTEKHGDAFVKLGLIQAALMQNDKAVHNLEKAIDIMRHLDNIDKEVEILYDLGIVLENSYKYQQALDHFRHATNHYKELGNKRLLASQYANTGRIYDLRLSQYLMAIKEYNKAFSLYHELKMTVDTAQTLLDIGRCYRLMGKLSEAESHYSQALKLIESEPENIRLKAKIIIEQANNAWYQARYQDAFNLSKTAFDLAKKNNWPLLQVISLNTEGLIWCTLRDNQKALKKLEKALSVAKTLKVRKDEIATTLNNMSKVYCEMKLYPKAIETIDKAITIDREINSRWAIAYDFYVKGFIFLRRKLPKNAIPLFKEAIANAQIISNRINETKSLMGLGLAHKALDHYVTARITLEKALDLSHSMGLREIEWYCLYELSSIKLKEGKKQEAKTLLLAATKVVENMRSEIKVKQILEGFVVNRWIVYETLISLLVDMGEIKHAFEVAERSRFIELLDNYKLKVDGTIEQDFYERSRELKNIIIDYEKLLLQASGEIERKFIKNELGQLKDEYHDMMIENQKKIPQLSSILSINPIKMDGIKAHLDSRVALAVYYIVSQEIFCWLIKYDELKFYRIPVNRSSLENAITDYRRLIQDFKPIDVRLKQLSNWLLSPLLLELEGISYLGIVPHGHLHYLSFATLPDTKGYLIDRIPLFYLPSTNLLRYTFDRRIENKNNIRVLAISNHFLDDPFQKVKTSIWKFPDMTIITEKVTESWLSRNIMNFEIIHMDALSSIYKISQYRDKDNFFNIFEISNLKLNTDLIVLNTCQPKLEKVKRADDVIRLNMAFFYAGTHTIISNLWQVSDTSTAILNKHFYSHYENNSKAECLREAMLHIRNRYPHPAHWGTYTLLGDYY